MNSFLEISCTTNSGSEDTYVIIIVQYAISRMIKCRALLGLLLLPIRRRIKIPSRR